jgi:hypothetical protein
MEVVYERHCGLDVNKQTVVACVIVPGWQASVQRDSYLRDDDGGFARARRLAAYAGRDACGHGKHWGVLEATVESAAGDADDVADNTFLYLAKVRLVTRDIPARSHMLAFGLAAWANCRSVPLGQGR